jgi:Abnormal spindle-like microcephaly-assoc'd, ASPM-SPD-2-Hydin
VRSDQKASQLASARHRRFAAGIVAMLAATAGISVAPAAAQTPLSTICVSPDITVALSRTLTPQQVQCYSFPGAALQSFAGIPAGVNVTGYFPLLATQTLLTIDTTAALPTDGTGGTVTVTPRDVASYNPSTGFFLSSLFFVGASNSVPDGTRIRSIGMDSRDLLLSFDVTISVPKSSGGTITVNPADLVTVKAGLYTLVFNSAAAGIPDGTHLDGATMLSNSDLLLTFDVIGSIAGIDFTPTDVLEFNSVANSWVLSFSGASRDDWPDGSLMQGVNAQVLATPTATATATTTPTPTATATPTATPTPVLVTLKIKPKSLKFGTVTVGSEKGPKTVTVTNPSGKKKKPGITVVMEGYSGAASPYSVTNGCDMPLAPGGECTIEVTFTPTASEAQDATLMIIDNAEHDPQPVKLTGKGK